MDQGTWVPTEAGTRQGSPLSPRLAHSAFHGLETSIRTRFPRSGSRGLQSPNVVGDADDLVMLHADHASIQRCQDEGTTWLQTMGCM